MKSKKKSMRLRLHPGDAFAIPRVSGGYFFVVFLVHNRFGHAFGLLDGTFQTPKIPTEPRSAPLPNYFYTDWEENSKGHWSLIGNTRECLRMFPAEPEIYHEQDESIPGCSPFGQAESPSGGLRQLTEEDAKQFRFGKWYMQRLSGRKIEAYLNTGNPFRLSELIRRSDCVNAESAVLVYFSKPLEGYERVKMRLLELTDADDFQATHMANKATIKPVAEVRSLVLNTPMDKLTCFTAMQISDPKAKGLSVTYEWSRMLLVHPVWRMAWLATRLEPAQNNSCAQFLLDALDVEYGFLIEATYWKEGRLNYTLCGRNLYEYGLDEAEENRLSHWASHEGELIAAGYLRDVYPVNYISEKMLNAMREFRKFDLHDWVARDSSRGSMALYRPGLWRWDCPRENIAKLRQELDDALIYWTDYQKKLRGKL